MILIDLTEPVTKAALPPAYVNPHCVQALTASASFPGFTRVMLANSEPYLLTHEPAAVLAERINAAIGGAA